MSARCHLWLQFFLRSIVASPFHWLKISKFGSLLPIRLWCFWTFEPSSVNVPGPHVNLLCTGLSRYIWTSILAHDATTMRLFSVLIWELEWGLTYKDVKKASENITFCGLNVLCTWWNSNFVSVGVSSQGQPLSFDSWEWNVLILWARNLRIWIVGSTPYVRLISSSWR